MQNEQIKEKSKNSNKNKTTKEKKKILLKIENTNLVKYGVKNVMQNEQILKM